MKVLDSSAMIAYLKAEPGSEVVRRILSSEQETYAHAINLCEVFYDIIHEKTLEETEHIIATLKADGIVERNDMDGAFWRDIASLIATRRTQPPHPSKPREKPRLALGDACGLALARRMGADFVSADRAELEAVHRSGLANVIFIR
jgi:PIN domain nuclease of toxin-antitoxin system